MTETIAVKPKKIDKIRVSTDEFLHELGNTETIFFEVLTKFSSSSGYGLQPEEVAEMSIDIDRYNEENPPAKISYKIKDFEYRQSEFCKEEEEQPKSRQDEIRHKMENLFKPQELVLSTQSGGETLLSTEQFKTLLKVFEPYFAQSWGRSDFIDYLYEETKKKQRN